MSFWNTQRRRIFAAVFHPVSLLAFFKNVLVITAIVIGFKRLPFSVAFILTALSYVIYFYVWVRLPTEIFYSTGSQTAQRLLAEIPCLRNGGYKTSFWTMNRHINTLWGVVRPIPDSGRLGFHREIAHNLFADGENCVLDWYKAPAHLAEKASEEWNHDLIQSFNSCNNNSNNSNNSSSCGRSSFFDHLDFLKQMNQRSPGTPQSQGRLQKKNPVIVVFHGLTTAYGDNNITRVVHALTREGWDAVIPVRRGCGDDPTLVTKPKYYAYGGLEDTAITIEYIAKRVPDHPLFAVGFSAGSNVMVNYLATQGRFSLINGALSIANGYCWQRGTVSLEKKSPIWNVAMAMLWKASVIQPHAKVLSTTHTRAVISAGTTTIISEKAKEQQKEKNNEIDDDKKTGTSNNSMMKSSRDSSSRANSVSGVQPITEDTRRVIADVDGNFESAEAQEIDRLYKLNTLRLKEIDDEDKLLASEKDRKYAQLLREAASIREIDELISKEIHGFESLDEFYAEQSCVHRLHRVKVPVVFCNALDDPIASADHVPKDALKSNENFLTALTPKGGHLGWAQGVFPFRRFRATRSWMDDLTIQSLKALMKESKVRLRRFSHVTNNEQNIAASARDEYFQQQQHQNQGSLTSNNNKSLGTTTFSRPLSSALVADHQQTTNINNNSNKNVSFESSDDTMSTSATSNNNNNNNNNNNTSSVGTPRRHTVATPTMNIPREIALFPKFTQQQKAQQQKQQQKEKVNDEQVGSPKQKK